MVPLQYQSKIICDLNFIYDAMGNRIVKISKDRDISTGTKTQDHWTYTYYVRDAQGNVMATYNRTFTLVDGTHMTDDVALQEADLYGSSRLGVLDRSQEAVHVTASYTYSGFDADNSFHITGGLTAGGFGAPETREPVRKLGYKAYELVNHLGNVLVTVSDRKLLYQNGVTIDYYTADVRSTTDYSAFGAPMPGRSFTSVSYRYGFNGKENDAEITGNNGTDYDFGARMYDARLCRFFSIDPMKKRFPDNSPYCYAINNPIAFFDVDGKGPIIGTTGLNIGVDPQNKTITVSGSIDIHCYVQVINQSGHKIDMYALSALIEKGLEQTYKGVQGSFDMDPVYLMYYFPAEAKKYGITNANAEEWKITGTVSVRSANFDVFPVNSLEESIDLSNNNGILVITEDIPYTERNGSNVAGVTETESGYAANRYCASFIAYNADMKMLSATCRHEVGHWLLGGGPRSEDYIMDESGKVTNNGDDAMAIEGHCNNYLSTAHASLLMENAVKARTDNQRGTNAKWGLRDHVRRAASMDRVQVEGVQNK
jgi:RHS repeat-associated protein